MKPHVVSLRPACSQRSFFCRLTIASALLCAASPCHAQPPTESIFANDHLNEWEKLRDKVGAQEVLEPEKAIARYEQFFIRRGRAVPSVGIAVVSSISQLHWRERDDANAAVAALEEGLRIYAEHPQRMRLQAELAQVREGRKTTLKPVRLMPGEPATDAAPVAITPHNIAPVVISPIVISPIPAPPRLPSPFVLTQPTRVASPLEPVRLAVPTMPFPLVREPRAPLAPPTVNTRHALAYVAFVTRLREVAAPSPGSGATAKMELPTETVDELWRKSALKQNDLLPLLDMVLAEGGWAPGMLGTTPTKSATRLAVAGLVARQMLAPSATEAEPALKLQRAARLAVADFFAAQRDARAVALYESLLAERNGQPKGPYVIDELWNLAAFYEAGNEREKAAQTLLRAEEYSTQPYMVGESRLRGARLYRELGQEEKAQAAYEKTKASGSGWMTGVALYDQASILLAQDKHEEARKLLDTPFAGQYAEQTKVGILALKGYSYFQTEEFDAARRYSEEAITQYEALKNPLQNEGLQEIVGAARSRLQTIEEWKNKAFELPLKNLAATKDDDNIYHAKIYVHSFRKQPVTVSFKKGAAELVALTQQSQKRADSGVFVAIYDLAYRAATHPAGLEAQVAATTKPQEQQTINLRYSANTDG